MSREGDIKKEDMAERLIRISNISKGIGMHLFLFVFLILPLFIDVTLPSQKIVGISSILIVSWYWFARIYEKYERKKKEGRRPRILVVENIVETIGAGTLLSITHTLNTPLFILFVFVMVESCLLLSTKLPWIIAGVGSAINIGEFLYSVSLKGIEVTGGDLFSLALRLFFFGALGWHFSALAKVTILERDKSEDLEKATSKLKRAYEELKKLDKAKSEFVSIASHQLRTPLTAIKGYISMIREKIYGKPPEKMEKPLGNIYVSNERLIKLVNDLLNVSRIEAGRMEMKLEKLSLEEIITSVVEELKNAVKEKNIYLKWEKPKKPLPKISVDRDKIRQVITNVIDNAIRYTEKGGVAINAKIQDTKYTIQISDTGVGLTKYELSKMFESFSRGAAGTRLYTEGVGLGLYVARRFIEMHKGKIWAESKGKGKGSTFYIEFPLK